MKQFSFACVQVLNTWDLVSVRNRCFVAHWDFVGGPYFGLHQSAYLVNSIKVHKLFCASTEVFSTTKLWTSSTLIFVWPFWTLIYLLLHYLVSTITLSAILGSFQNLTVMFSTSIYWTISMLTFLWPFWHFKLNQFLNLSARLRRNIWILLKLRMFTISISQTSSIIDVSVTFQTRSLSTW